MCVCVSRGEVPRALHSTARELRQPNEDFLNYDRLAIRLRSKHRVGTDLSVGLSLRPGKPATFGWALRATARKGVRGYEHQ